MPEAMMMTSGRELALRVLETGPCRYSNTSSFVQGTVRGNVADFLAAEGLVVIADPTDDGRDRRQVVTITPAGIAALAAHDESVARSNSAVAWPDSAAVVDVTAGHVVHVVVDGGNGWACDRDGALVETRRGVWRANLAEVNALIARPVLCSTCVQRAAFRCAR